jgi:hypothetical protein
MPLRARCAARVTSTCRSWWVVRLRRCHVGATAQPWLWTLAGTCPHSEQRHQVSDHAEWVVWNQQWLTVVFRRSQVRASRGLPLRLMAAEYERILKRRLRIVGGSPDDPALGQLLAVFRCVSKEMQACSILPKAFTQQRCGGIGSP